MCDTVSRSPRGVAVDRPRWELLYVIIVPQILALGSVEAMQFPHATRIALRYLLALGFFVGMAAWIRANRPAFDLQDWCDCAGARMTVRVIQSRWPQAVAPRVEQPVAVATATTMALAEEDYEVAIH